MVWNLEEAFAYYRKQGAPSDQSALISLLREIQQENGGSIPAGMVKETAEYYGVRESFLLALIKRIPSLRLSDSHCLEVCSGPNCGRHTALANYAGTLKNVTVKFVPCMRMCGKGPNIRWDGKLYSKADAALLRGLLEESEKE